MSDEQAVAVAVVTSDQIAVVVGVSARAIQKRAAAEQWPFEQRPTRGGQQRFYLVAHLPSSLQALLAKSFPSTTLLPSGGSPSSPVVTGEVFSSPAPALTREERWAHYERRPERQKQIARDRMTAIDCALSLIASGLPRRRAFMESATRHGCSVATLYRWHETVRTQPRHDWLPFLVSAHIGRAATVECSEGAWDFFKADYLRLEQPAASAVYERMLRAAKNYDWTVPALKTLMRRLDREIPRAVITLAREGMDALQRSYPAQERDRSVFHALEALNADGHKFDVFVKWPDGEINRPVMVGWQDLYTGKLLAYRVDKTENTDAVRLSFGDVVERFGIPSHVYLDNGRSWASKWMTGGLANRYRFKVKDEEPLGLLTTLLGPDGVHWTTPYHGQAKPIERAWRDLCETVAKHPGFTGAYTGNKPDAKPENYGSRAIELNQFLAVLEQEIIAHNARTGRRSAVCNGRSFDAVFNESYARAPIRKATNEQRRLWLLAADVSSSKQDGTISLGVDRRNRYWAAELADHAGESLVVRFDPQTLHDRVTVYTLDGRFICEAQCVRAAGFNDTETAREHSRARNQFKRHTRAALDAEVRMDAIEAAKYLPAPVAGDTPPASVVRAFRPANHRMATGPTARELTAEERALQQQLIEQQEKPTEVIEILDTDRSRYGRAVKLEKRIAEGLPVDMRERTWLASYQSTAEYSAQKVFHESFGIEADAS